MLPEAMRTCVILSGSGAPAGWSSDCVMSRAGWSSIAGTSTAPGSGAGSVMSTMLSAASIHIQSEKAETVSPSAPVMAASIKYSPLRVMTVIQPKPSVCDGPMGTSPSRVVS